MGGRSHFARWYRSGALVLFVLQIADLLTTAAVVALGGYEANTISAWLLARHLLVPAKLGVAGWVAVAAFHFERKLRRRDAVAIWLVVGVYVCVVAWNVSRVIVHATS